MMQRPKNYFKRNLRWQSHYSMSLPIPEKGKEDVADDLMRSIPNDWLSEGQNKEELQPEASSQNDSEGDDFMTGTIDRIIPNNPSDLTLTVTENNTFKCLERANSKLASQQGAYVWSDGLQAGIDIDVDVV